MPPTTTSTASISPGPPWPGLATWKGEACSHQAATLPAGCHPCARPGLRSEALKLSHRGPPGTKAAARVPEVRPSEGPLTSPPDLRWRLRRLPHLAVPRCPF